MKKIVVLTGAGMSVESGLKTFRDADGLWENYPAAGLLHYARPDVPVYLIDPNPVNAGGRVQQIQKGASEGMKELCEILMK